MTTLYIELDAAAASVGAAAAQLRRGSTFNPDTLSRAEETMDDAADSILSAKRLLQRVAEQEATLPGLARDARAWIDSVEDPR